MKNHRFFLEFDYLSRYWSTFGNGFTGRVSTNIWHLSFTEGLFRFLQEFIGEVKMFH